MKRDRRLIGTLVMVFVWVFTSTAHGQDYKQYPMWNDQLPMDQRVNDLVNRLTLEEKVGQMLNAAPAIERLGIPAYEWWNEVLHGVARTPYKTTVFPQAIAMAATWDTSAIQHMARFSAMEGRAIHHLAVMEGKTGERYKGLTYWTPNINIFRDPRWGRGQETYGEDPVLTAKMGAAFVRGLQGNNHKYLLAAACAKHFAVHSGPEHSRHVDNISPSAYDLWDTYLPAFHELVVNANVAGVMCAYNALNTEPCCGNDLLMTDILRRQWHFNGYVTSDCGAIDDFVHGHKTSKTNLAAAVDAVSHGTDVECGNTVYHTLVDAVKTGQIDEKQLDVSLKRLFMVRYRLGMFDPASKVPYATLPMSTLQAPDHQALALKMARESIVLLKNNGVLPLSKKTSRILVIGPNADNRTAVLGNYNGFPERIVSVLNGIREKLRPDAEVRYMQGTDYTNKTVFTPLTAKSAAALFSWPDKKGFQLDLFKDDQFKGKPVRSSLVPSIQPGSDLNQNENGYTLRYSRTYVATTDSNIILQLEGNNGYRLKMNGSIVVNQWDGRVGSLDYKWHLKQGQTYKMELEVRNVKEHSFMRLKPGSYRQSDFGQVAQKALKSDVIIYVGGITPELEGEEMSVNAKGFSGGDRTSIMLPEVQTELMQALHRTGKPVIFVMLTGSAIAIPWAQKELPAIVNAWYGGQSAGTAVADVLFGDYNPSGRLPVTFYKDDASLPDFKNYDMTNRTYRYYKNEVLYPFGYGLSYTTFKYADLDLPAQVKKGQPIKVKACITNTGKRAGDEVVELYLSYKNVKGKTPLRALKKFQRIHLNAGQTRIIHFDLQPGDLSLVSESGASYLPEGQLSISIGSGQPVESIAGKPNVVKKTIEIR